ncbi:MAG: Coenzyme F420 hydrogenase/dehydrogenase, beta subunit C-terminal domain [Syntrophobacteria bacterium]
MYLARADNDSIVHKAASGGGVTALLGFALQSGMVDGVVSVRRRNGNRYDGVLSAVTEPDQVIECAGTLHCAPVNVAHYIRDYLEGARDMRLAVSCKPCDARAIIELAKVGQIELGNLILIGLNCTGTLLPGIAREMLEKEYGINPADVAGEEIDDGKLIITCKDGTKQEKDLAALEEKGYGRRENCRRCPVNIPTMADLACGKWGTKREGYTFIEVCSEKGSELLERAVQKGALVIEPAEATGIEERKEKDRAATESARQWARKELDGIRQLPYKKRWEYWSGYFSRCIKCYACRDVCPMCYCQSCYLYPERDFIEGGETPPDIMFPLVRLAHVGHSCVNCGQCQDACPMQIPLTRLYHMVAEELSLAFDYTPGMSVDEYPPLTTVSREELQCDEVDTLGKKLK